MLAEAVHNQVTVRCGIRRQTFPHALSAHYLPWVSVYHWRSSEKLILTLMCFYLKCLYGTILSSPDLPITISPKYLKCLRSCIVFCWITAFENLFLQLSYWYVVLFHMANFPLCILVLTLILDSDFAVGATDVLNGMQATCLSLVT